MDEGQGDYPGVEEQTALDQFASIAGELKE